MNMSTIKLRMEKRVTKYMKVAVSLGAGLAYLLTGSQVFADPAPTSIDVRITPPSVGVPPTTSLATVIRNALTLLFSAAALIVLFMLAFGAFQWITSGGDKDAIDKARKRIINALIGLAILSLAFLIAVVAGNITGVDLFNLKLPQLGQP